MDDVLRFWSYALAPYVVERWYVTALLLAICVWCGLELMRGRPVPKVSLMTIVWASGVMLFLPLFVSEIEGVRLFAALYIGVLVWAISRAAPHRRVRVGVAMLSVWVNFGTLLTALLWGV